MDAGAKGFVDLLHGMFNFIKEGDLLAYIETDKATMEFESFQEGVLLHIGVQENETAAVDAILAIIGEKGEDVSPLLKDIVSNESKDDIQVTNQLKKEANFNISQEKISVVKSKNLDTSFIKISPLAKKIAMEKNIDIQTIKQMGYEVKK